MRRAALVLAAAAGAVLAAACPQPGARQKASSPAPKPRQGVAGNRLNVLLVTIDTLRADHLGAYGYRRATSPNIDALARRGVTFDQAYTYWPKTRGSFVALHTGRLAAQSGYGKTHPLLVDFNPTLASVLQEAGYDTVAVVDNPNVAASLGYSKGFARYRETWEEASTRERDGPRARHHRGRCRLPRRGRARAPLLPVAALRQPARSLRAARALRPGLHRTPRRPRGRCSRPWPASTAASRASGPTRGEGSAGTWRSTTARSPPSTPRSAGCSRRSTASPVRDRTLVVLSSDHGESLGEHDYFFDHGENLFDPSMRIPLLVAGPGDRGRPALGRARHDARPRPDRARRAQGLLPARPRGPEPARCCARRAASRGARGCRARTTATCSGPGAPASRSWRRPRRAGRATRSSTGRRTRARRGTPRARSRDDARRAARAGAVP